MTNAAELSRRERQIMDVIFARGEASVVQIQAELPDAPSATAIRTLLRILEQKGHVRRRKNGRQHLYRPQQARKVAGLQALRHVLKTFYEDSLESALAAHLTGSQQNLSDAEVERLTRLIQDAQSSQEEESA